jgi:hypothetical protein
MHSSLEREDQAPQREGNYGQALREKATMAKLSERRQLWPSSQREGNYGQALREKATMAKLSGEVMALSKMRTQ